MMWQTLFRKEILENWRTWRTGTLLAVFLIAGAISPVLAKYTPALLASIPDLPPGMAAMIPEPSLADAVGQYLKNLSQFGVLLIVVLLMGAVAQERERGTAAMLFVKPVQRSALVVAKWLAGVLTIAIGLAIGGVACGLYTLVLFGSLPFTGLLLLNLLLLLFFAAYLSLTLLASAWARSQGAAAGMAFGGVAILLILSSLPRVGAYMPAQLLVWGQSLALGGDEAAWPALVVALGICVASLALACWRIERVEI